MPGARVVDAPVARQRAPAEIPMASAEDIRWAQVKATAAQWFARRRGGPADSRAREATPVPLRRVTASKPAPTAARPPVAVRVQRKA